MNENKEIWIKLNAYQVSNLRWLLRHNLDGNVVLKNSQEHCNTGDWAGEIPFLLEQEMVDAGITDAKPNRNDKEWPFKQRVTTPWDIQQTILQYAEHCKKEIPSMTGTSFLRAIEYELLRWDRYKRNTYNELDKQ